MGPHAPPLIGRVHAIESQEPRRDGCEGEQFLPAHVPEIYRDDVVRVRPNICEMISGLHRAGRYVAAEEQESCEPQQAVQERCDAFVEANSPLHPSPVDVSADMAVQVSA